MRALRVLGAMEVGASSAGGQVMGDATGLVGGAGSLSVGGDVSVESGGAGSATFGDGVSLSGGSVVVESGAGLVGVGRSVDVVGSEGVRVGSTGAVVELGGAGETEYVGYVWRSSASFDEFTNTVPSMTDVEEVLIRSSRRRRGARVVSAGGRRCRCGWLGGDVVDVGVVVVAGCGLVLDGRSARVVRAQTVVGIRLSSMPSGSGSFEGWEQVVFHFGRASGDGSVRVASARVLEAVSGEAVSVSSESVSVSAGRSLEVSGGESVSWRAMRCAWRRRRRSRRRRRARR